MRKPFLFENYGCYSYYFEKFKKTKKPYSDQIVAHRDYSLCRFALGLVPNDKTNWNPSDFWSMYWLINRDIDSALYSIDPYLKPLLNCDFKDLGKASSNKPIDLYKALELTLSAGMIFNFINDNFNKNKKLIQELVSSYNSRSLDCMEHLKAKLCYLKNVIDYVTCSKKCFDADWFEALVGFASDQYDLKNNNVDIFKYLSKIQRISCGLPLDASKNRIENEAKIISGKIRSLIKKGGPDVQGKIQSLLLKKYKNKDIEIFKGGVGVPNLASKRFWVNYFWDVLLEAKYELSRLVGLVGIGYCENANHIPKFKYVPDFIFKMYREKCNKNNEYLSSRYLISADKKIKKTLKEIVDNKRIGDVAERALFIKAQSYICQEIKGWSAYFLTVTLPPEFHPQRTVFNNDCEWTVSNPKFSGMTVRDGFNWWTERWNKFRSRVKKVVGPKGWGFFGSVEMHTDGTPHWHVVLYFPAAYESIIRELVLSVFVLQQKGRVKKDIKLIPSSVLRRKIEFGPFRKKHGAENYAIKMAAKVMKNDDESLSINAWFSLHKKRRTFSSFLAKGLWRSLRYVQDPDLLPDQMHKAWHYSRGVKNTLPRLNEVPQALNLFKRDNLPARSFDSRASCSVSDVVAFIFECSEGFKKLKGKDDIEKALDDFNMSYYYKLSAKKYHKELWGGVDAETGEVFLILILRKRWISVKTIRKGSLNKCSVNSFVKNRAVSPNDGFELIGHSC